MLLWEGEHDGEDGVGRRATMRKHLVGQGPRSNEQATAHAEQFHHHRHVLRVQQHGVEMEQGQRRELVGEEHAQRRDKLTPVADPVPLFRLVGLITFWTHQDVWKDWE